MVYFCADDYGISKESNNRIETCFEKGVLNKISVLPNGEITDFNKRLNDEKLSLSLHLNLVEGRPLSNPLDVDLLITDDGFFKYSFLGLFLISFSLKRKRVEHQIYKEIKRQIAFWKETAGGNEPISIDSHQHTHMIPFIFKTLMRVIKDEKIEIKSIRFPSEPILPFILSPSLYLSYSPKGLIKQWLLKVLGFINRKQIKKADIKPAYFMGVMFSGELNEKRVKKLLKHYLSLSEKNGRNIEIGFHPGYSEEDEKLLEGARESFNKFYFSPWRKAEFDTLINF